MQAPSWWFTMTGTFAVLGSLAFIAIMISTVVIIRILLDVRTSMLSLNQKLEVIAKRVDHITETVEDITMDVGTRTKGIVKVVDDHAATAFGIVEKVAPILVGIGVIGRIVALIKKGK